MFIQTFTDAQGVTHTDALFKVKNASSTVTNSEDIVLNTTDHTVYDSNASTSSNANYQMYFWTSQASFDSGFLPYLLVTSNRNNNFSFSIDSQYDGLTLEEKCDKHCRDVIIPTLS